MMTELKPAVLLFRKELEVLETDELKNFAHNALSLAKPGFYENEYVITHTQKVFRICKQLLDDAGTMGSLKDGMLIAVLLMDIAKSELSHEMDSLHPVAVKPFLESVRGSLNKQIFDAIINMIEGHEAENSPAPSLEPKGGTPGYLIALANKIVRMGCVSVEI